MPVISYVHFFCFVTYLFFGVHILSFNKRSLINRVVSMLIFCFAIWSLSLVIVQNTTTNYYTAKAFFNISAIGWVFMSGLSLWFHLIFTGKEKLAYRLVPLALITLVPAFFYFMQLSGFLYDDLKITVYGWKKVSSGSFWLHLFFIYSYVLVIYSVIILYNFVKNTPNKLKKKQGKVLLWMDVVMILGGTLFEIVIPELTAFKFPHMGNISLLLWMPGVIYAMSAYKLLIAEPSKVQHKKIMDTIPEAIVVTGKSGNIESLNSAAIELTGYRTSELALKSIQHIFKSGVNIPEANTTVKSNITENLVVTKSGDEVNVTVNSSPILDDDGRVTGQLYIINKRSESIPSSRIRQEHMGNLRYLSDTAIGFLELSEDEDIYQFIGEKIKSLAGENSIVIINAVDETLNISTVRAIYGLGKSTRQVMRLLGSHPLGSSYKIIENDQMPKLYTGKLIELFGGFYELTFRQVAKSTATSLEKLLKMDKSYGIAFVWNGMMYGNAAIITRVGHQLENAQIIETLAYLTSIALQKRITETALRFNENKYRNYINNSPDGILVMGKSGGLHEVNEAVSKLTGFSQKELLKFNFTDLVAEESDLAANIAFEELNNIGKTSHVFLMKRKKENDFYMQLDAAKLDKNRFIAFGKDVTSNIRANEKLKYALEEKDVLLKEVHHRVKNNMQVIISLINMQLNDSMSDDVIDKFRVLQERVRTMSFIHEGLYNSEDLSKIEFGKYIDRLSQNLIDLYGREQNIQLNLDVENVFFDINKAIPCGLVVNELISNSLKYAFDKDDTSKNKNINIKLKQKEDEYLLNVGDNGKGLPNDIDLEDTNSLGLWLVNILVKDQLEGDLIVENKQGVNYNIRFPVE